MPLIERIRARGFNVLATTGTVTSAALAEKRLPPGAVHQFIPIDLPAFVTRFLDYWRPDLALFVESDLWPNLIVSAAEREVPIILVNGRMSERSFRRWRHFPRTIEALLTRFDLCLVRTTDDAERFGVLGAPRITTTGNLKLDAPALPFDPAKLTILASATQGRAIVAAASTHPGEESEIIDAHRRLRINFPDLLTIIAPRHPQRGPAIAELAVAARLRCTLRSRGELPGGDDDIYLFDTLGELGLAYQLAPIVFMGGSLVRHGGQNPIEAVKFGAAILHGPHVTNFTEIYDELDGCGGATFVTDVGTLTVRIAAWIKDAPARDRAAAAARLCVDRLGGALERTVGALEPYFMQLRIQDRSGDA
jgi:3-deoxy-D-manno-octulosonic-acid transferase